MWGSYTRPTKVGKNEVNLMILNYAASWVGKPIGKATIIIWHILTI